MERKINKNLFPKTEEIYSWIKDLTQWGHRKTGTPEGRKSAEYIADKFNEFGLEDVIIEKVPSICMIIDDGYELTIDGEKLECFYANGTHHKEMTGRFAIGEEDTEHEFVYLGLGLEEDFNDVDVDGKIVVCSIEFPSGSPVDLISWNENSEVFDPEGKIHEGIKKADIYSPNNWPYNYFYAIQNGAKGFVGILENYFDDPYWYCEDYTEVGQAIGVECMSIPGMFVSRSTGKALKEKFSDNNLLKGKMKLTTTYEYRDALNVSGKLKGKSDDIILVHSHHDAVFDGAVQDASGISEMMAIAKYFAQTDYEDREKTLMFAATDTHYTDYMGHQGFIEARKKNGENLILDITLEHLGKEVAENENGELVETGEVETRVCYVTKSTNLYDYVKEVVEEYDLKKMIFFPVQDKSIDEEGVYTFKQDEIITDAYYFNENDIPVISFIAGEVYIFHPSDTIEMIPVEELQPVGMAFAEIVLEAGNVL